MTRSQVKDRTHEAEVLGEWWTDNGNLLTLMARRFSGSASIWLNSKSNPVKIGCALHAGGVVREVRWEAPWREQTDAWKTQQRIHIASLIAAWHANMPSTAEAKLPSTVLGTFDIDGFRFAVEPSTAPEHAILSIVNVTGGLTPIADVLHENGRICGMTTRPGWKSTPDDRRRHWRREAENILTRAADEGQP